MDRPEHTPGGKRWSASFAASITCHVLLAMLIVWQHVDRPLPKHELPKSMDVVLLNPEKTKPTKPPKKADAISNRTAQGSSARAQDQLTRAARSPMIGQRRQPPKPAAPQAPRTPPPAPKPEPRQRTRTLARRGPMLENTKPPPPKRKPKPKPKLRRPIPMANLMPSSMAMAELSRDFERERRLKKALSREADIPINTREAKFAPYAHLLVRALEEQWRPGQANYREYPTEERRALMRLTIERDGSLGGIEILRPSPIRQLNESAVAAIHAAAPFRPLPRSWGLDRVSFYLTFEVLEDRFVFRSM
ncbi:MAG: hypothetical protein BMS9Abin18_1513 [Zetaproteobacteria bacterium]|nr:MAG: hypothetical protein BMS9Abin18_1513 [Zetaproteobacteria bacterium]